MMRRCVRYSETTLSRAVSRRIFHRAVVLAHSDVLGEIGNGDCAVCGLLDQILSSHLRREQDRMAIISL